MRKLLLFAILFLCMNGGSFAAPVKSKWVFILQPWKKTSIFLNGKKVRFKAYKKDKSMARISLKVAHDSEDKTFQIRLSNKGYREVTEDLQTSALGNKEIKKYFILDKIDSKHSFQQYWQTGKAPKSVTFIDDTRIIVPLLSGPGADIVDIHSGYIKTLTPPKKWAKGQGFVESLVLKKYDEIYVSQMYKSSVHKFKFSTLEYTATLKLKGNWPKVLKYDESRDVIYSSNWGSRNISIINRKEFKEIRRIKTGGVPRGMQLSKDSKFLYATLFIGAKKKYNGGQLIKIDLATRKIIHKMGVFGAKRHVVSNPEKTIFYTTDMAKRVVESFNVTNDTPIDKIRVNANPNTIVYNPSNSLLYVSCRGKNNPRGYHYKGFEFGKINIIDPATFKVIEKWEGGNQPTGLAISPGGKYIVFSDFLDHAIRVYKYNAENQSAIDENIEGKENDKD